MARLFGLLRYRVVVCLDLLVGGEVLLEELAFVTEVGVGWMVAHAPRRMVDVRN
jgi:hypothetical protein